MVGRESAGLFPSRCRARRERSPCASTGSPHHPNFARHRFELRRGEIVGVAGLLGSGRTELVPRTLGTCPRLGRDDRDRRRARDVPARDRRRAGACGHRLCERGPEGRRTCSSRALSPTTSAPRNPSGGAARRASSTLPAGGAHTPLDARTARARVVTLAARVHALRGQPAEDRDRAPAPRRSAHPPARRTHARNRHREQGRACTRSSRVRPSVAAPFCW